MFSMLDAALDRTAQPWFFFRDDDADRDCAELRGLLDLFGGRGVPLSLAVIPGTLTEAGARLLAGAGENFELHQHGWMHVNHEPAGRQCEFGPARGFAAQREDLRLGRERLRAMLGDAAARPVFTPPWNRCTRDTYRALAELGFGAISRDGSPRPDAGASPLADVPVSVDLFRWKSGAELKNEGVIEAEIVAAMRGETPVGILLHHKVMSGEAFALVGGLLDRLAGRARFTDLEEVAASCVPATS